MEENDLPSSTVEVISDTPFIVDNGKVLVLENAVAMIFSANDQVNNFLARNSEAFPSHPWEVDNGVDWTSGVKEGGDIVVSTVPQSSKPQPETPTAASPSHPWEVDNGVDWTSGGKDGGDIVVRAYQTKQSTVESVNDGVGHGKKLTGPKHGHKKGLKVIE